MVANNSRLKGSAAPPVAATIFFGANDAALLGRTSARQHVPVDEYKENLRRMVQHLKVHIFLCFMNKHTSIFCAHCSPLS